MKEDFDAVGGKGLLVLTDDAAFGGFQDGEQIIRAEGMANDAHRQTADEFRLKAKFYKIARLNLFERPGLARRLNGNAGR